MISKVSNGNGEASNSPFPISTLASKSMSKSKPFNENPSFDFTHAKPAKKVMPTIIKKKENHPKRPRKKTNIF